MKIRPITPELVAKAGSLVDHAFAPSRYELRLFDALHAKNRPLHEWVCIHRNSVIAYICFSRAFHDKQVCGLHLAPLAVQPKLQGQGLGSELLRFALRQHIIASQPIFVLGRPAYYQKFGFVPCSAPLCPFDRGNKHFLSLRNPSNEPYTISYEPEFSGQVKQKNPQSRTS